MKIKEQYYHTIWLSKEDNTLVNIIDQRALPHEFIIEELRTLEQSAAAIKDMHVRGAPLIGVTAAFGMYLAAINASATNFEKEMITAAATLKASRPTAVDLAWAVDQQLALISVDKTASVKLLLEKAKQIKQESIDRCQKIGLHGLPIIQSIFEKTQKAVNILTHCNAGWFACVDYGTATAPIYAAHEAGIPVHVWVDETRPRNQGARITAFELKEHGVPHTVITDNTGGHLMQHGRVDMVIVGTDRTTRTGDVCNKIGTYLKALAAKDNKVPFYVAAPYSSIDWSMRDGVAEIPIEIRDEDEVKYIQGLHDGKIVKVLLTPEDSPAENHAFDVTPSRLVTALITEAGVCTANEESLQNLFSKDRMQDTMQHTDEGYIKFNAIWSESAPVYNNTITALNQWRQRLYDLGFLGAYPDGIGYGNVSHRAEKNSFYISGSKTGNEVFLSERHYAKVTGFDIAQNQIHCSGPIIASSESMSHAVIYQELEWVNAVFHIHDLSLWKSVLHNIPTTRVEAAYGTPEMALEIIRLIRESIVSETRVFAMAGHEEGLIAFGASLEEAGSVLLKLKEEYAGI